MDKENVGVHQLWAAIPRNLRAGRVLALEGKAYRTGKNSIWKAMG